ncbi:hypothetical protein HG530_014068 [Fusarium avenaceum]|nr:hypothetical protein HG530_014068 [Fusarium avenaceum]
MGREEGKVEMEIVARVVGVLAGKGIIIVLLFLILLLVIIAFVGVLFAVADKILERFQQITKEILVDEMGVLGQTLEDCAHEMRYSQLENAEVGCKHQLECLRLHTVELLVADGGICVSHVLVESLLLLQRLAMTLGPEFALLFLEAVIGALNMVLGALAGEFGESSLFVILEQCLQSFEALDTVLADLAPTELGDENLEQICAEVEVRH